MTKNTTAPLPDGLFPESAEQALNGPIDQRIRELRAMASACEEWGTTEAKELAMEAAEYLSELEEHP